ncbi:MAG: type IV toxin-antitoxin system AbiEi family antitoxin [Thermosynechococcaceae cyanobacterium]
MTNSQLSLHLLAKVLKEKDYLIGGELGAALATKHLRPIAASIYVPERHHRQLTVQWKLQPSEDGEISFMKLLGTQTAWHLQQAIPLADPLLIQAEILLNPSDRLQEVSQRLYAQTIAARAKHA